jgi:hypothetical protein
MSLICYKWKNTNVFWKNADWKWSECQLIQEILSGVGNGVGVDATTLLQPWLIEPWSPYRAGELKKRRLIKLICKVKGVEYNEEKMIKNFKVTADDIKLVVKAISGINIDLKREE